MLLTLSIKNFAIIERLDLEFAPGFNVLTGETGAGKSILMDALNLILGGRSGGEIVRGGAERATIDAVFDLENSPEVQTLVQELGFDLDENRLFLAREVQSNGKSLCRIAGRPATVTQLREIGEWLVDLHGQHEHQSLLAVARHLDMLDAWGGKEVLALREIVSQSWRELQNFRKEKESLEKDSRERIRLLELFQFQAHEISVAKLHIGEDDELIVEARRLSNAQKLAENAAFAACAIGGGEDERGVLEGLNAAIKRLEEGAEMDESLTPLLETVRSASYELIEAERDLAKYQNDIEFNPERLEEIEERLQKIRNLKRKYGNSVEEVLKFGEETVEKLEALNNSEARGAKLDSDILKSEKKLVDFCRRLSKLRAAAADKFQRTTVIELCDLGMDKTRFEVRIEQGEPNSKGTDRVEFQIAANPGEPLRPLAKVASGGEISRVTLAIKSAMARQEALPTMVFDEIDVGVGGRTASVLADKLSNLAKNAQIICITHLAQIASRGNAHFYIEKQVAKNRTTTSVKLLTNEERVTEIARMIGGAEMTETVLKHARELLSPTYK